MAIAADLIRHAGIGTEIALTELFNYMWEHLDWPPDLQEAYLVPLYKKLGSRLDPGNFRMIAIQSVVAKLFEKILDRRLREWVERAHGLSDLQGGSREGRGTLDQIFILDEVVSSRLERKLPTCCAFIDVRKAYDRVWRVGLWAKLHQLFFYIVQCFIRENIHNTVKRKVNNFSPALVVREDSRTSPNYSKGE